MEAQSKLEQLQKDIAELSSLSPDTVAAEEEVTRKLQEVRELSRAWQDTRSADARTLRWGASHSSCFTGLTQEPPATHTWIHEPSFWLC